MALDPVSSCLVAAIGGFDLSEDEAEVFSKRQPAGIILFKRNIPDNFHSVQQTISKIKSLNNEQSLPPLIVSIDQEGGRVARIKHPDFPNLGPALNLFNGMASDEALAGIKSYGQTVGASLKQLGININFAPVVDILTNEQNTAIGDRVFGRDADTATKRAKAFLLGMQSKGVLGCLKHFPGQGDATGDTHLQSIKIDVSSDVLSARELVPFSKLVYHCHLVMISHCIYSALDQDNPASLSNIIVEKLLRQKMAFKGVVVSDDMNMKAIDQNKQGWQEILVRSIIAGVDLLLLCKDIEKFLWAYEGLSAEYKKSKTFRSRLDKAAQRVLSLRKMLF